MSSCKFLLVSISAVAALVFSMPSFALPAMDLRVEDLIQQSADVKKSLNLNPNQQILWQQVESKMRFILGSRQTRRERLQAELKRSLDDPRTELRDVADKLDAENDLSNQENKQLRELWLAVNDALNDAQRQIVLAALADQLQRIPDQGLARKTNRQGGEARSRGVGRQKPGGIGGELP